MAPRVPGMPTLYYSYAVFCGSCIWIAGQCSVPAWFGFQVTLRAMEHTGKLAPSSMNKTLCVTDLTVLLRGTQAFYRKKPLLAARPSCSDW